MGLPDGRRIRGRGLRKNSLGSVEPEFGVYLLGRDPNIEGCPSVSTFCSSSARCAVRCSLRWDCLVFYARASPNPSPPPSTKPINPINPINTAPTMLTQDTTTRAETTYGNNQHQTMSTVPVRHFGWS